MATDIRLVGFNVALEHFKGIRVAQEIADSGRPTPDSNDRTFE